MSSIIYEIEKHYGELSKSEKDWTKELNLVSWHGRPAKYDIREWSPDKDRMGRGITLTKEELRRLYKLIGDAIMD